jgi:hypothetical protein
MKDGAASSGGDAVTRPAFGRTDSVLVDLRDSGAGV